MDVVIDLVILPIFVDVYIEEMSLFTKKSS